ncbi:unnamed protein product [Brugia timori]|uniref:CPXV012 protein n=1 Tax=Brugia timori TaxID=42155 RepID=A0A0R3R559_9BILA|nr:unnamed protein product [Brugia timori]
MRRNPIYSSVVYLAISGYFIISSIISITMLKKMVLLLLSFYLVTADKDNSDECITRGK